MADLRVFVVGLVVGVVVFGGWIWWAQTGSGVPYGSFSEALDADGTAMQSRTNATDVAVRVLAPDRVDGIDQGIIDVHALVYNATGPSPLTDIAAWVERCDRQACDRTGLEHADYGVYVASDVEVPRDGAALRILVTTVEGRHLHFDPP